jgi:hypothetical protein
LLVAILRGLLCTSSLSDDDDDDDDEEVPLMGVLGEEVETGGLS